MGDDMKYININYKIAVKYRKLVMALGWGVTVLTVAASVVFLFGYGLGKLTVDILSGELFLELYGFIFWG